MLIEQKKHLLFEVQHADNNWQAIGLGQATW